MERIPWHIVIQDGASGSCLGQLGAFLKCTIFVIAHAVQADQSSLRLLSCRCLSVRVSPTVRAVTV